MGYIAVATAILANLMAGESPEMFSSTVGQADSSNYTSNANRAGGKTGVAEPPLDAATPNPSRRGIIPRQPGKEGAALPVLVETSQSEDPLTRLRGLEGLAQTAPASNVGAFLSALSDSEPDIRDLAQRTLASLDPSLVFERVMGGIRSRDGKTAWAVDGALPVLRSSLETRMLGVLQSNRESVSRRQTAAYCLGRMNSVAAIPALADFAMTPESEVAPACAYALMAIRDPLAIPWIEKLAGYPDGNVQVGAIQALAAMAGPESIQALGRVALGDQEIDKAVRQQATALLAATRDEQAIPVLIDIVEKDAAIRGSALAALRKLTGRDPGDTAQDWREWYQRKLEPVKAPADGKAPPSTPWEIVYVPQ